MATGAYKEIVVGTDGSPTATAAVRAAIAVAKATSATLTIITGWHRDMNDSPVMSKRVNMPADSSAALEANWAQQTALDAATIARQAGIEDVRQSNPQGSPAETLVGLSEERAGSLIVVGTLGLSSRTERIMGNIPNQVAHHAVRDALFVQTSDGGREYEWGTVALATDGSPTAMIAVQHGLALARAFGSKTTLLTAAKDERSGEKILTDVASQLEGGSDLGRQVAVGKNLAEALADAASGYDLLVLGNKGTAGPSRFLGSIANSVITRVPTDLLLVNTTR